MDKLRIGIVGCGKQAEKHIYSLKKIPYMEAVLSDIQPLAAKRLAEKTGSIWVDHPDEIYADDSIKSVVICTPTPTHVSLIEKAIAYGMDVFCEKPLCDTPEEAKRLQNLPSQSEQVILIGYVYRYVPIFEEGFRLFREQTIGGESLVLGKPVSAYFRLGGRGGHQMWKHMRGSGGGAINEMLVHMLDLANWYFGPFQDIEVISCDLRCPARMINGEMVEVNAEDYILVKCTGENGLEIFCQADLISPAFVQYVEVQTEKGTFMGSIQSDMPSYIFLKEDSGGYSAGKTELKFGQRNVFDMQMLHFVYCILKRGLPDKNRVEDSLQLVEVIGEIRHQADLKLKNGKQGVIIYDTHGRD